MVPVRLIAIDIDGTLIGSTPQVSEANRAALQMAHEHGVEIALATGRRHAFALPVASQLGFPVTLISSNGAVTRSSSGELFHLDKLPRESVRALVEHMSHWRDYLVITFDREVRGALIMERKDLMYRSIQRWLEKNEQFIEYCRPIEESLSEDPIQAMFCGEIANMEEAEAHLKSSPSVLSRITLLKTQYNARNLLMLDIINAGCSKGHALERWCRQHAIPREAVAAIGDNYNDLEMLKFAGRPFLMGNACDELRQSGLPMTLTADDHGVAHAVEQLLG